MGRCRTELGSHGKVTIAPVVEVDDWGRAIERLRAPDEIKSWLSENADIVLRLAKAMKGRRGTVNYSARTEYRSLKSGEVVRLQAEGATEAEAEANLLNRVEEVRLSESGARITAVSSMGDLLDVLIESIAEDPKLKTQSRATYRETIARSMRPPLAHFKVRDLDTATINSFLRGLAEDGRFHDAKVARLMLNRAAKLAIGFRALDRNPVPDAIVVVDPAKYDIAIDDQPETLTEEQITAVRVALRDRETPTGRGGPTPDRQLRSIFELYAALSRPGEVLALRIRDVDLDAPIPTLTFAGSIVEADGVRKRQATPKKKSSYKVIELPPVLVAAIRRRLDELGPDAKPEQLLFTTRDGRPRPTRPRKPTPEDRRSCRRTPCVRLHAAPNRRHRGQRRARHRGRRLWTRPCRGRHGNRTAALRRD